MLDYNTLTSEDYTAAVHEKIRVHTEAEQAAIDSGEWDEADFHSSQIELLGN